MDSIPYFYAPSSGRSQKRMKRRIVALFMLPLLLWSVLAMQYNQSLNPGDSIVVSGLGQGTLNVVQNGNSATLSFVAPPEPTPQPSGSIQGIWMSQAEIMQLPMNGTAWDNLKSKANGSWGTPNLQDISGNHDVYTLAGALYYARTGDNNMRTKIANAIMSIIGTENGGDGRTLGPSRNIVSYIIAADLINLATYDAGKNNTFKTYLTMLLNKTLDSKTIKTTHNIRPNNWGTHAGAARVAIDRYTGDTTDLALAANVFKGWLGNRTAYNSFDFGDLWWQSDPTHPVAINPVNATIQGHNVDGVLPDDQRRAGGFTWPPQKENYTWEALQGASVQAQLLSRAAYDVWNWSDKAMLRAVTWLYNVNGYRPEGDDVFIPWIINKAYKTSFATISPVAIGKNMSFTDWTHR